MRGVLVKGLTRNDGVLIFVFRFRFHVDVFIWACINAKSQDAIRDGLLGFATALQTFLHEMTADDWIAAIHASVENVLEPFFARGLATVVFLGVLDVFVATFDWFLRVISQPKGSRNPPQDLP